MFTQLEVLLNILDMDIAFSLAEICHMTSQFFAMSHDKYLIQASPKIYTKANSNMGYVKI